MRSDWLSLLARRPEGAPPVLALLAPAADRGATAKLLAESADALLAIGELGMVPGGPGQSARLAGLARRLEGATLLPLADAIGCVAGVEPDGSAAALLRAVHILDRTRAHVRRLAWLGGSVDRSSPRRCRRRRA